MFYLIGAMLLYAVAMLLGAYANKHASVLVVSFIIAAVSIIIPMALVIPQFSEKWRSSSKSGIVTSVISGVVIALFALFIGKAFSQNKVAIVGPVVFGGAIALSTIGGYYIFKEKVQPLQGLGIALVLIGLVLVTVSKVRNG